LVSALMSTADEVKVLALSEELVPVACRLVMICSRMASALEVSPDERAFPSAVRSPARVLEPLAKVVDVVESVLADVLSSGGGGGGPCMCCIIFAKMFRALVRSPDEMASPKSFISLAKGLELVLVPDMDDVEAPVSSVELTS